MLYPKFKRAYEFLDEASIDGQYLVDQLLHTSRLIIPRSRVLTKKNKDPATSRMRTDSPFHMRPMTLMKRPLVSRMSRNRQCICTTTQQLSFCSLRP